MHTVGNKPRNHAIYASLEELFRLDPAYPAANLEPYYAGWNHEINRPGRRDARRRLRARQLLRTRDDVRLGPLGRARGPRVRHRRLRRDEHRRAAGLAPVHLGGAALRVGRADAAPGPLRALRGRPLPAARARFRRPDAARSARLLGRRPRRLELHDAHAPTAASRSSTSRRRPRSRASRASLPDRRYAWSWYDPRRGQWRARVPLRSDTQGRLRAPAFPGGGSAAGRTGPRS